MYDLQNIIYKIKGKKVLWQWPQRSIGQKNGQKKFSESFLKQKNLSKLLKAPFIVAGIWQTSYDYLKIILKVSAAKNNLKVFNILWWSNP